MDEMGHAAKIEARPERQIRPKSGVDKQQHWNVKKPNTVQRKKTRYKYVRGGGGWSDAVPWELCPMTLCTTPCHPQERPSTRHGSRGPVRVWQFAVPWWRPRHGTQSRRSRQTSSGPREKRLQRWCRTESCPTCTGSSVGRNACQTNGTMRRPSQCQMLGRRGKIEQR